MPRLISFILGTILGLAAILVGMVLDHAVEAAAPPEGQMSIVAPAIVPDGTTFTIDLVIDSVPLAGYVAHQERLHWTGGLVYSPSTLLTTEVLAPPRCTLPVRVNMGPNDLLIGCVVFPAPAVPFFDVGGIHRLTFTCHAPGGSLTLTTGDNLQSIFVDGGSQEVPMLLEAGAMVLCPKVDTDGDGCFDNDELALGLDPGNPLDWSDFDHSGAVDAADVALAVQAFGTINTTIDRTGDGVVSVGDITHVVSQFGVSCPA